jgi:hypothetical protein
MSCPACHLPRGLFFYRPGLSILFTFSLSMKRHYTMPRNFKMIYLGKRSNTIAMEVQERHTAKSFVSSILTNAPRAQPLFSVDSQ